MVSHYFYLNELHIKNIMRKTNLFYTSGVDSKFLTFSNYTESLTGNFISTDTKIFPSKFLCIEAKKDDTLHFNKEEFIKVLITYYENKLAALRDHNIYFNEKCEDYMTPLAYLLKSFDIFFGKGNWQITYYGDITEQDFNGTYTDTICVIDSGCDFYKQFNIIEDNSSEKNDKTAKMDGDENETPPVLYTKENNKNCLYNWDKNDLITFFETIHGKIPSDLTDEEKENYIIEHFPIKPIFDDEENYAYKFSEDSLYKIEFKKNSLFNKSNTTNETVVEVCESCGCEREITQSKNEQLEHQIRFNIVIPLFEITNMNYHANDVMIDNNDANTVILDLKDDAYRKNVPLGIWFADEPIVLKKDLKTGFAQTWSLVISSQFKPFPYAKMQVNQTNDMSNSNAFPTFAMVLSKQNEILEKFNYLEGIILSQQEQISNIQAQIKNTVLESNVDNIKKNFMKYQYDMTEKFNKLKQTVTEFMDNIRWNGTE